MKRFLIALILASSSLISNLYAQSLPVKLSKSGICHAPGSRYYEQTKNYKPYKTLNECLRAGGRLPK